MLDAGPALTIMGLCGGEVWAMSFQPQPDFSVHGAQLGQLLPGACDLVP